MREKCTRVSARLSAVWVGGWVGGRPPQIKLRFMSTTRDREKENRERKGAQESAYYDFLGRDFVHSEQSGARASRRYGQR
jgi:hypothetical protein